MTIDAINGTVSLVMPKVDWHEQHVAGNGLAVCSLNGNVLIGAYSSPGDGGQQGACVIRRAKIWQNVALNYARIMAEYRLALADFAVLGIAVCGKHRKPLEETAGDGHYRKRVQPTHGPCGWDRGGTFQRPALSSFPVSASRRRGDY